MGVERLPAMLGRNRWYCRRRLGPKADSGIHFSPNLLVESMHMSYEKGLGLVRGAGTRYYAEGMATPGRHLIEPIPLSQPP